MLGVEASAGREAQLNGRTTCQRARRVTFAMLLPRVGKTLIAQHLSYNSWREMSPPAYKKSRGSFPSINPFSRGHDCLEHGF